MEGRLLNQSPISRYLIEHKHPLIGLFVTFLIGVVLGSYTMVESFAETLTMSVPSFTVTAWSINEYVTVFIDNVWLYAVLYVAGLSFIGLPIIYFTYMVLGVRVGYTIAVCLSTYEYRGVILAMSALVMDHLIFLPLSLLFGIQALHIHKLFFSKHSSHTSMQLPRMLSLYHRRMGLWMGVIMLLSGVEYSYFMYLFPRILAIFT